MLPLEIVMGNSHVNGPVAALKGFEAVRKRPGMYIGSTDSRAMHILLYEIVSNAAFEGICMPHLRVEITLQRDGSISVADNARGFPDRMVTDGGEAVPFAQWALTSLHGGKGRSLNGIGVSVAVALSEFFLLETGVKGKAYTVRCERGRLVSPWQCVGEAARSGTRITFKPDPEIFGERLLEMPQLLRICRERAWLQENIHFVISDRTPTIPTETSIVCKGGMLEALGELGRGLEVFPERRFYVAPEFPMELAGKPVVVSAALAFTRRSFARISSFANFIPSADGGTHVEGFRRAIDGAFEMARVPRESRAGLRRGLIGALHVYHPDVRWDGCTKSKVGSPDLVEVVREALVARITGWMEENLVGVEGRAMVRV